MSSPRLRSMHTRGFGTGVCSVSGCFKVAEAVVWSGLETHAKEKEKNYMQEVRSGRHLRLAWIIRTSDATAAACTDSVRV